VHFLEHPGYWKNGEGHGVQGRDYYSIMAQAKLVLSTTGRHNISVRKHLEAIGARAKILGNHTGFSEHAPLVPLLVRLNDEYTESQIIETIRRALSCWTWEARDEQARKAILSIHAPNAVADTLHDGLCTSTGPS
jgi:hypothetical protein